MRVRILFGGLLVAAGIATAGLGLQRLGTATGSVGSRPATRPMVVPVTRPPRPRPKVKALPPLSGPAAPGAQAPALARSGQEAATPVPASDGIPTRLVIPAIRLDAPVVPVSMTLFEQGGQTYGLWNVPDGFAAGWHDASARAGEPGNLVLSGHHNTEGEVFRDLVNLEVGDWILLYAGPVQHRYRVAETHILPEKDQPLSVRVANAGWIAPTADERLTLATCWPYTSNTHRLIVVARPVTSRP